MSLDNEIPAGWTEEILVDCLDSLIDYRGKTPKKSSSGILTLSAKSVKMGYIDYNQAYYISKETYKSFMVRGFPKVGDVLMTTEAPLGCIARLDRDDVGIAQRLLTLRGKENVLDNNYLRYYLTSRRGQHELKSRASGSTVQGIKRTEFEKIEILFPKYEEQKAIANILTAFDDKIENLQAQNKTLEQTAQTIFKEWFGKYQVGDELPDGWIVGELRDLTTKISKGTTPRKNDIEGLDKVIPFLKVKDISDNGLIDKNNLELIPEEVHSKQLKRSILESDDILFSIAGTIGRVSIVDYELKNSNCNQALAFIRLKEVEKFKEYIHLWLKSNEIQNEITNNIVQGVQANVSLTVLGDLKIIIPSNNKINEWKNLISPIYTKLDNNNLQIQSLKKTRDTLLPKLMRGSLRVEGFKEK